MNFFKALGIVVAVFVGLFAYNRFAVPISISSTVNQKTDFFSVTGQGKVTVVPDTGLVDVGINISKATVKEAQNEANSIINQVSSKVKSLGVDAKDIKTSNYSIYPEYSSQNNYRQIIGYRITASLNIKVRNLDLINKVIDSATTIGANTIRGITLTVDEDRQKELLQTARKQAIEEAKAKAKSLASDAGITLGKIINISESGVQNAPRYFGLDVVGTSKEMQETSIEPGSTNVTSTVTLSYEIK